MLTIPRLQRAASVASHASSSVSYNTDNSRSASPNALEMARWGTRNRDGTWTCSYRGCTSRATFSRGCDLRKHYKRHTKSLFCRYDGCPQATSGGFSSKKDRLRHEQKHNPQVRCEFEECGRLFSRVDNMVSLTSGLSLNRRLTISAEGSCSSSTSAQQHEMSGTAAKSAQ